MIMVDIHKIILKELVEASHGGLTIEQLSPELKMEELGINSMALITILFGLEDAIGIDISELGDDLEAPETVGELLKIIDELSQAKI